MKTTALGLVAVLAVPAIANADPFNTPGTTWYVAPLTNGNGCATYTGYRESDFQLVFTNNGSNWTVAFRNPNWVLPIGRIYNTFLDFGYRQYTFEVRSNTSTTLESGNMYPEAVRMFAGAGGFVLRNERGVEIGRYGLAGSAKALTLVAQCGAAMKEAQNANPFESGRSLANTANPFERDS